MEVGRFDLDSGMDKTVIQVQMEAQKHDLGRRGVPSDLDGLMTIEAFSHLGRFGTTRQEAKDVINKQQS